MNEMKTKKDLDDVLNKILYLLYLCSACTVLNIILTLTWILMMWIFTDVAHITIIK